jgi:CBS domain containing-hemolysin-like protein
MLTSWADWERGYFAVQDVIPDSTADAWVWPLFMLLGVPALVLLNGLFVAVEFSLVAIRKTRVEEMIRLGLKGASSVEHALEHLDRSIAASQLGITLASIGLGWIGEPVLARLLKPLFSSWGPWATHSAASIAAFILITYLHVVFGELLPKNLALQMTDRTALWLTAPLVFFTKVTRPLTWLMTGTANGLVRWLGYEPTRGEDLVHSVEELALLIEDMEEAGILAPDQAEFVQNVFRLSNKRVRDCMVPRERMAALELTSPPEKILEAVRNGAHTRMPVYDGNLDNIVGIVNAKNLFYVFSLKGVVVLDDALYEALYLKPDITIDNALQLFRKSHRPMALVRDDNGKTLGLITLEDVLEEIVGDIEDEHDRPVPKLTLKRWRRLVPPPAKPPVKK